VGRLGSGEVGRLGGWEVGRIFISKKLFFMLKKYLSPSPHHPRQFLIENETALRFWWAD